MRIIFILALFLSIPTIGLAALPKVAVIPCGEPKPDALLALSEAELFARKNVALLERAEIDKVFAEQELVGLFSAASAVELGRILKTDIFVALETTSVVIFDARTGLRFVDEILPAELEDAAQAVAGAVDNAMEKRGKLHKKSLTTFGILEARNIDLPAYRDAWCGALAGMLERSLLDRGGAVLERSRLRLVNEERRLTGDDANDLLAAMKLIDLEFTRGETPETFGLSAAINGKIYRAQGRIDKPQDVVDAIAGQLLAGKAEKRSGDEAARFMKEAHYFRGMEQWADAIEKMETAVALEPENEEYRGWLFNTLVEQLKRRIDWKNDEFEYDQDLLQPILDAEAMQQSYQQLLRLESLAASFSPEKYPSYNRFSELSGIRRALRQGAAKYHPEYINRLRAVDRRFIQYWLEYKYRPSLSRVVDGPTLQWHFYSTTIPEFTAAIDGVAAHVEVIENTLRLIREYKPESTDPAQPEPLRVDGVLENFATFAVRCRKEKLAETNPEAARAMERTIALMEQHPSQWVQICAWLAENRDPDARLGAYWMPGDPTLSEAYYQKVKAYLASLPEGLGQNNMNLYQELVRIQDALYHRQWESFPHHLSAFTAYCEILELADSRGEFSLDVADRYIFSCIHIERTFHKPKKEVDKTDYLKMKQQYDPLLIRQIERGESMGMEPGMVANLRERAENAKIIITPAHTVIAKPWIEEISLFPPDDMAPKEKKISTISRPDIYGNVLECWIRGSSGKKYLGWVNLDTLERQYISLPHNSYFLTDIDDVNFYFVDYSDSSEFLFIHPRDGSEPRSLEACDDLPDKQIEFLGILGDWCYTRVGVDWIYRLNLRTGKWKQLSSSRAKTGRTPFVDGKQLLEFSCLKDKNRERILLSATKPFFGQRLWAIEKSGAFVPMNVNIPRVNAIYRLLRFFDGGDKLLFDYGGTPYVYDCVSHSVTKLSFSIYSGSVLGEYFWGGIEHQGDWRWARKRMDDSAESELLPVPDTITMAASRDRSRWFPATCAPMPNGKGLIVSGDNEVVFLRFSE